MTKQQMLEYLRFNYEYLNKDAIAKEIGINRNNFRNMVAGKIPMSDKYVEGLRWVIDRIMKGKVVN